MSMKFKKGDRIRFKTPYGPTPGTREGIIKNVMESDDADDVPTKLAAVEKEVKRANDIMAEMFEQRVKHDQALGATIKDRDAARAELEQLKKKAVKKDETILLLSETLTDVTGYAREIGQENEAAGATNDLLRRQIKGIRERHERERARDWETTKKAHAAIELLKADRDAARRALDPEKAAQYRAWLKMKEAEAAESED